MSCGMQLLFPAKEAKFHVKYRMEYGWGTSRRCICYNLFSKNMGKISLEKAFKYGRKSPEKLWEIVSFDYRPPFTCCYKSFPVLGNNQNFSLLQEDYKYNYEPNSL